MTNTITRTATAAIRGYIDLHPEVSEDYRNTIWFNFSDYLNRIVLGVTPKQAKEIHISTAAFRELKRVEALAVRLIDNEVMEPLEAVQQAFQIITEAKRRESVIGRGFGEGEFPYF